MAQVIQDVVWLRSGLGLAGVAHRRNAAHEREGWRKRAGDGVAGAWKLCRSRFGAGPGAKVRPGCSASIGPSRIEQTPVAGWGRRTPSAFAFKRSGFPAGTLRILRATSTRRREIRSTRWPQRSARYRVRTRPGEPRHTTVPTCRRRLGLPPKMPRFRSASYDFTELVLFAQEPAPQKPTVEELQQQVAQLQQQIMPRDRQIAAMQANIVASQKMFGACFLNLTDGGQRAAKK